MSTSLTVLAAEVLSTADPAAKVAATLAAGAMWRQRTLDVGCVRAPDQPARPARPVLSDPRHMPRRSMSPQGRVALVHALAHIEFNAVDLAWDILVRFASDDLPRDFYDDWVDVACEEAEHFAALARRLGEMGAQYGDLEAHNGLWDAAVQTNGDLAARLAVIPLTLEARGLDTTPATTERLRRAGDAATAAILDVIYADEIKHLAVGVRWFEFLCAARGLAPEVTYRDLLAHHFTKGLKGPFNLPARAAAGMGESYLAPWLAAG